MIKIKFPKKISKRHLAKAISWRFIGTVDTIVLSFFISSDINVSISIGVAETFTKIFLYYFHEKLWFKSSIKDASKRHIYKTFLWRVIATLDTIILSWFISGSMQVGLKIGLLEIITKMILYFFHEKL